MIQIEARNNLNIPVRLTITNANDGRNQNRILVTIGKEGTTLREFHTVCIDADLPVDEEWQEVGGLNLEADYHISVSGKEALKGS